LVVGRAVFKVCAIPAAMSLAMSSFRIGPYRSALLVTFKLANRDFEPPPFERC
jgi:hypothetical protein